MIPWFQYTTIHLGPIPIQVWGLFVALGMVVSLAIIWRESERRGLPKEQMIDLAFWMIIGGLIGGRLFHVFLYEPGYYLSNPIEMLKIWHGGMSSFGGIVGALASFLLYRKKNKKSLPLVGGGQEGVLADLFSFAALFGWIIGRIGCVMIHDHLGIQCPNCFLAIRTLDGTARLDMALIEIITLIPLVLIFFFFRKKNLPPGFFFYSLMSYYGAVRFVLDFFRAVDIAGADARYLGLTPAQYFAMLLVILGGVGFFRLFSRRNI